MRFRLPTALLVCILLSPVAAMASEADFLKSIEGQWTGGGSVLTKLGGSNVGVSCKMKSTADNNSFTMDGSCRALVVVTRTFTAQVEASGTSYSGTYVGMSGKPSTLRGSRDADTITLNVTWAVAEYGNKQALLTIEKVGDSGLHIRTVGKDPQTGKPIVTTDLKLTRK